MINFGWFVTINTLLTVFLENPVREGGYGFTPQQNAACMFRITVFRTLQLTASSHILPMDRPYRFRTRVLRFQRPPATLDMQTSQWHLEARVPSALSLDPWSIRAARRSRYFRSSSRIPSALPRAGTRSVPRRSRRYGARAYDHQLHMRMFRRPYNGGGVHYGLLPSYFRPYCPVFH